MKLSAHKIRWSGLLGLCVWLTFLMAAARGQLVQADVMPGAKDITKYFNADVDYSDASNLQQDHGGAPLMSAQVANPTKPLRFKFDSVTATNLLATGGEATSPAISSTSVLTFTIDAGSTSDTSGTINTSIFGDAQDRFSNFLMMFSVPGAGAGAWFDLTSPGVTVTGNGTKVALVNGAIPIKPPKTEHSGFLGWDSKTVRDDSGVISDFDGTVQADQTIKITVDMAKVQMQDGKSVPVDATTSLQVKQQFTNTQYTKRESDGQLYTSYLKLLVGKLAFSIPLEPKVTSKLVLPPDVSTDYFGIVTGTITQPGDKLEIGVDTDGDGQINTPVDQASLYVSIVDDNKWVYVITKDVAKEWGLSSTDGKFSQKIVVKETQTDLKNSGTGSTTIAGNGKTYPNIDWTDIINKIHQLLKDGVKGDAVDQLYQEIADVNQQEAASDADYAITLTAPNSKTPPTPVNFMFAPQFKGQPAAGSALPNGMKAPTSTLDWQLTKQGNPVGDAVLTNLPKIVDTADDAETPVASALQPLTVTATFGTTTAGTITAHDSYSQNGEAVTIEATFTVGGATFKVRKLVHILALKPVKSDLVTSGKYSDFSFNVNEKAPLAALAGATATWHRVRAADGLAAASDDQDLQDGDGDPWALHVGAIRHINDGDSYQLKVQVDGKTALYSNVAAVQVKADDGFAIDQVPDFKFHTTGTSDGDPSLADILHGSYAPADQAGTKELSASGTEPLAFGAYFGQGVRWQLSAAVAPFTWTKAGDEPKPSIQIQMSLDAGAQAGNATAGILGTGTALDADQNVESAAATLSGTSTGNFSLYRRVTATMAIYNAAYAKPGTFTPTITWRLGTPPAEAAAPAHEAGPRQSR
ncbi:hypothetical protein ACFQ3L_10270 [Lacticaseibacillus jixianensis]|uniref:WxL domain-containing protein n=1 Tax=Lacticaseibacillus jixianensis TaxID=2486012 RepID=A0ABW4BAJ4_9LACO|nr:hypothetical protein [Lacticaseibacillus jixianensis]